MQSGVVAGRWPSQHFLLKFRVPHIFFQMCVSFGTAGIFGFSDPGGRERTKRRGAHSVGSHSEAVEDTAVKRLQAQKGRKNGHRRGQRRCAKPSISRNRDKQTLQSQGQRPSEAPSRMIAMPKMGPPKLLDEWPFCLCAHAIPNSVPSVYCF